MHFTSCKLYVFSSGGYTNVLMWVVLKILKFHLTKKKNLVCQSRNKKGFQRPLKINQDSGLSCKHCKHQGN